MYNKWMVLEQLEITFTIIYNKMVQEYKNM